MATLTDEQTDFLKSHHIPLDKTFDASGLSNKAYKAKMKDNGTLVAYGLPPCPKGHTLRNKQANCLQCNPHAVASIKRQATTGDVYIAVSPSQRLTKIGVTENAHNITAQMNAENHADSHDWQLMLIGKTPSIGQMENHLQQRLADCQIPKKLTQNGKTTKASQIFDLDPQDALAALNELPFSLEHIDTAVMDEFQQRYSQKIQQQQQQVQQLAEQHAQAEQARLAQQERQKQAELEAKQLAQQRLQQEKLAQKQQRQQAQALKKQQTVKQKAVKHTTAPQKTQTVTPLTEQGKLIATPKIAMSAKPTSGNKFAELAEHKAVLWFIAGIIVVVSIIVLMKLLGK